jgi:uncharacterized protein YggE
MSRSFLIVAAAMGAFAAAATSPLSAETGGRTMRIIGRAIIEKAPDIVNVTVGVTKRSATPTAALDQNSDVARKIVDFSKNFGIQEQDIRTASVNLSQEYKLVREPDGTTRQEPDGYIATNSVRVRLRDLSRVGDYMRQVLDQGATNIGALQFGLSDPETAADEAGTRAVNDAFRRAQRLATPPR